MVDEDDGQPYYDALMDWQDGDDNERDEGAEDDHYEALDYPYFTPGLPIQNYEEFRMIKGFSMIRMSQNIPACFTMRIVVKRKYGRFSSSFFYDGPVNVNGASVF